MTHVTQHFEISIKIKNLKLILGVVTEFINISQQIKMAFINENENYEASWQYISIKDVM